MSIYTKFLSYIRKKIVHQGLRRQVKNMGWMFFARVGTMIIALIVTAYIARNLGPKNYGELSYAISFVSLFTFIAALGIDQILHKNLIEHPEKRNVFLGSAIALRIFASLAAIGITVIATLLFSSKDVSLLLIFIISLSPLFGSLQLLGYEFQAETNAKYPSILIFCVVIVLNLLKIFVIFLDKGVIYLALVVLLEPILYSLGYLYLKNKFYGSILDLRFSKAVMFSIFKSSYPLMFATAFYLIYSRIDQVMLKHMINAEAVGLYDAAVRISEISYFIPQILLVSLLPPIINAKKISNVLYYKRTKKLLLITLLVSAGIALVTTLFSKYLIAIIFGAKFYAALPILYIYAWSGIGAALTAVSQQILLTENLTSYATRTTFSGMITNILLNILLIPRLGMSGAALATLISYTVPFLSLLLFKRSRKIVFDILRS